MALRLWAADWIVGNSNGRLTHQTVWKDAEAVEQYRKTMIGLLTDMAYKLVAPGDYALSTIQGMIDDVPTTRRADTVESRTAAVLAVIQANAIRQDRNELVAEIRKDIDKMALQGKFDPMEEDLKRKITGEQEKTARFVKQILSWSEKKIDAEREKLKATLEGRENLYRDAANGSGEALEVAIDADYHVALMKLQMLERWGGVKRLLPAEIMEAGTEIRGWMVKAQERLHARWLQMAETKGRMVADIANAVVPEDADSPRKQDGWFDRFLNSHLATVQQRLEGIVRNAKDEPTRKKAMEAISELMFQLNRGSEVYSVTIADYRKQWIDAVVELTGSRKAAAQYLKHLDEPIPAAVSAKISLQGYGGTMTYGQAMQLYASIVQPGYAGNVMRHKRKDHSKILEGVLTVTDLKMVRRLRGIYEARREALSAVVRSVTGIPVWRPDPLYMPVQMKTGSRGGLGIVGTVKAWNPLAASLTPRVKNHLDFDESVSIQDMFHQRSEDAARAIAFGARGILIRGVLGNADLQNAVERYAGRDKLSDLLKQVTQAMAGLGREREDAGSRMAALLRRVNTYTALSGNLLSAFKQTVSFPVFAITLDDGFRGVVRSMKDFDWQTARDLMDSDGYRARYGGGIAPEVAEVLRNPGQNMIKRLYQAGMTVIQIGDMFASLSVATGIYKAKLGAYIDSGKYSPEEAKERAKTATWAMVEQTQQSSRPENMPTFYRNANELQKLFYQFASAPFLQLSHEFHALLDVKAGREGAWGRFGRAFLVNHVIVPAMLDLMTVGFARLLGEPPDEDEELWRRVADRMAWNLFIGPISRLLIVGAVADGMYDAAFHGKLMSIGGMLPAESTIRALDRIARTPYDLATQDTEALHNDLVTALESLNAPFRHLNKLYQNRIAE